LLKLEICGEFDMVMAPSVRHQLLELIAHNPGETVVIDLSRATFIDSTAIGVLVGAQRAGQGTDVTITLHAPQPHVWRILTIVGVDKFFDCSGLPPKPDAR
jgi:anti-sigma B factor antagonist